MARLDTATALKTAKTMAFVGLAVSVITALLLADYWVPAPAAHYGEVVIQDPGHPGAVLASQTRQFATTSGLVREILVEGRWVACRQSDCSRTLHAQALDRAPSPILLAMAATAR